MNKLVIIAAAVLCALCCLGAKPGKGASAPTWEQRAQQQKADYLYMEAMRLNSIEDGYEAYLRHIERAAALDPDDQDMAALNAITQLLVSDDSLTVEKNLEGLRRSIADNPRRGDYANVYVGLMRRMGDMPEVVRVEKILDSIYPDKTDLTLQYADDMAALYQYGDTTAPDRALAILNRLESGFGKEPWLVSRKVRVHSVRRDTVAIFNEVSTMIEDSPKNVERNLLAGQLYEFFQRPDSALVYYNRACELDSTAGEAYYYRAQLYMSQGDSVAYDREIYRALQQESLELDVKLQLLTNYVRELYSDSSAVVHQRINNLFDIMQDQHPHEGDVHFLYGNYLMVVDRKGDACDQLLYAVDCEPSNEKYRQASISALLEAEDYQRLEAESAKAMPLFPNDGWYAIMHAMALSQLGQETQAIDELKGWVDNEQIPATGRSSMLSMVGDLYYQLHDVDSSMVYYERALEVNPENISTMNNMAYHIAEGGGDLDRAERLSLTTIQAEPENATYLDTYAWVMFKKKDYQAAKVYIDKTIEVTEDDELTAELLQHAGDIYFFAGEPAQAVEFWQRALKLDPDDKLLKKKVAHSTFFFE